MLSDALRRRFPLQVEIEPYTEAEISEIMVRSAGRLSWPLSQEATEELAKYARSNPSRGNSLLTLARNKAVTTGTSITYDIVRVVIEQLGLYPQGLTKTDVQVLK